MSDNVPPQVPPNHAQINMIVAGVAHNLKKDRHLGGVWRNVTSKKIQERGEAYMDASRILINNCHPMMHPNDQVIVTTRYKLARNAMAALDNSGVSGIRKNRQARKARALGKNSYLTSKGASDRALDGVLEPLGGVDPPAVASPSTPEESDGTDLSAGESPGTLEAPDTPPPHGSFTDSHAAVTSSIDESTEDIETTPPSGAAGIGVLEDDASESYSFFYDPDLAASGSSIASYKTERTVKSRKSRYNVRPRHKYADHGYLRPQGPASSGVEDASVPKTELRDEHVDDSDESPSSPHSVRPGSPGPSPEIQPLDGPSTAPPDTEHVHGDMPSQPPSPYQGVGFLSANPAALTGRSHEIGSLCSADVFGSDSEAGAD